MTRPIDLGMPADSLSDRLRNALRRINQEAQSFNAPAIDTVHLFLALLRDGLAQNAFAVTYDAFRRSLVETGTHDDLVTEPVLSLTPGSLQAVRSAAALAAELGHDRIGSNHLVLALLADRGSPTVRTLGRMHVP